MIICWRVHQNRPSKPQLLDNQLIDYITIIFVVAKL